MNKPWSQGGVDPFANTEPLMPAGDEELYAQTSPAPLEPSAPAIPELTLELAPLGGGEDELLLETRKDGRVCPQPTRWLEFYRLLLDAKSGAALPAPPLSGSAWLSSPPNVKRACFAEQASWVVRNGCTAQAHAFLSALSPSDWYYGD